MENHDLSTMTIYEGIAFRAGDMKLLMSVPNASWHKPPELGEEQDMMQHKVHVGYMKYLWVTETPCIINSSFCSEAEADLILIQISMHFSCKCELVSMRKAVRSVRKQSHLQPRFYSKARSLNTQL